MKKYLNFMDEWLRTEKSWIYLIIIVVSIIIGNWLDSLIESREFQVVSTGGVMIILSTIRAYTRNNP